MHENLILVNHPLVLTKLAQIRSVDLPLGDFRRHVKELSQFLAYEACKNLPLKSTEIKAALGKAQCKIIKDYPIVVSIMRAGNPMLDGILAIIEKARAGHIGIYRDRFINNTVEYYFRIPKDCQKKTILLCDPVVATADTALGCIERLKQYEVGEIRLLCFLISKEGLKKINHFHPDVKIFTIEIEKKMTEKGYLYPGIGDVGARLYNQVEL